MFNHTGTSVRRQIRAYIRITRIGIILAMANALVFQFTSTLGRHQHLLWQAGEALPDGLEIPRHDDGLVRSFPRRIWNLSGAPRAGRYYPTRFLPGSWTQPVFRVLACDAGEFRADLNPPAATVTGRLARLEETALPGGLGTPERLLEWPGMECPLPGGGTDFDEPGAFTREDEAEDALFYREARPVLHVDTQCAIRIRACYDRLLAPGMAVLDLMSGWISHLPEGVRVTGLGMNRQEMEANAALGEVQVRDLNADPRLPFADGTFDAVVNTVSIEYLTDPDAVLAEVRRVLKPGGVFAVTFSHRYFPTKVISLWPALHPMERLGWVLQRMQAAGFRNLVSQVERGLPRPEDDRYRDRFNESDPLFAAWGRTPDA